MYLVNKFLKLISLSMFVRFIFRMVAPLIVMQHQVNLHAGAPLVMLSMTILFESFVETSKPNMGYI